MAIPPVSTRSTQVPPVESTAPITPPAARNVDPSPLDLLIFTSEEDWENEADRLLEAASKIFVNAEVVFAEHLAGNTVEDKLASLHKMIGEGLRSGEIHSSTVMYVSLHGHEEILPDTSGHHAASQTAFVFSADDEHLNFPGATLVSALRHASSSQGNLQPDFRGLILWGSCGVRKMAPTLQACGGENILLAGNKSLVNTDSEDCLLDVIDLIGARKRESLPSLTGRDYWTHLRNVSGEHIAYVQEATTEIHKVLASGSSEPVLRTRSGRSANQPQRILDAKLVHGSPKAMQAFFDTYDKESFSEISRLDIYSSLALDKSSDAETLRAKMAVLEKNDLGFPRTQLELLEYLTCCARSSNVLMLSLLLQLHTEQLSILLPDASDQIAKSIPGLTELFVQNEDIAQQWLSVVVKTQPPDIGRAIQRYLTETLSDAERPGISNHLCLANRDLRLMNLLRNAFELKPDWREAEALMPFTLSLPEPSQVHSYLNVLLERSLMSADGIEIQKMLARYGIKKVDYQDFFSSANRFTHDLRWIP